MLKASCNHCSIQTQHRLGVEQWDRDEAAGVGRERERAAATVAADIVTTAAACR